jgi:hypothetical protein
MIRKLSFIWLLCCAMICQSWAQGPNKMSVLHVSGNVKTAHNKTALKLGQTIARADIITFAGVSDKVIVWNDATGLTCLHPKETAAKNPAELTAAASSFETALPAMPARGRIERFSNTQQLARHFQARKYLLLGKSWLIAEPNFPLKGDSVLIVKYRNIADNYQESRKFETSNDTLWLNPKTLLEVEGAMADPSKVSDYRLWWYHKPTRTYKELTYFELVVADEAQLQQEIQQLLTSMKDRPTAEKAKAVRQLVEGGWGEPDPHNYQLWMKQHFPQLN